MHIAAAGCRGHAEMCTFPSLDIVDQEAILCLLRPRLAPLVMVMSFTSAAERTVAVAELVCTCLASTVSVSVDLVLAPVKISERRTVQSPDLATSLANQIYCVSTTTVSVRSIFCVRRVSRCLPGAHLTVTKDYVYCVCITKMITILVVLFNAPPPAASIPCIYNISIT